MVALETVNGAQGISQASGARYGYPLAAIAGEATLETGVSKNTAIWEGEMDVAPVRNDRAQSVGILHRISVAAVISASVILAIALVWSAGTKPARAFQACQNAFAARYPASTSTASGCAALSRESGGGAPWNAYGSSLQQRDTTFCQNPPFADVENLDSDGIAGTNLAEINANAQPGWCNPNTPGCNNQKWDRNGNPSGTATPPANVLLDPDTTLSATGTRVRDGYYFG